MSEFQTHTFATRVPETWLDKKVVTGRVIDRLDDEPVVQLIITPRLLLDLKNVLGNLSYNDQMRYAGQLHCDSYEHSGFWGILEHLARDLTSIERVRYV
jgi:hypothetical protein